MKKYLMGIFAAAIATSLSAFTAPMKHKSKNPTTHWFILTTLRWVASGNSFTNPELQYYGTSYPMACPGSGKYCNVEFSTNQVIDLGGGNVTLNGTQSSISNDEKN